MLIKSTSEFPDLSRAELIAIDLETYDPGLKDFGPGAARGDGFIAGFALGVKDACWYLPINHSSGNLPQDAVIEYMKDITSKHIPTIGANYSYDLQWMYSYGIKPTGKMLDVQLIESLIDEERWTYALDALAQDYLNLNKDEKLMVQRALELGLIKKAKTDVQDAKNAKKVIADLPADAVATYAAIDAMLCIQIYEKQIEIIKREELEQVLDLECRLTPLIVEMTMRGVRIDLEQAKKSNERLLKDEQEALQKIYEFAGYEFNVASPIELPKVFDEQGIEYPRNKLTEGMKKKNARMIEEGREEEVVEDGSASITGPWLEKQDNEFCQTLLKWRQINKNRKDFIETGFLTHGKSGRVHSQFHQNRKDAEGTRSGRFSSSNPNLQQIPSRNAYWKEIVRGCYLPEEGEEWHRYDYKSQEPLLLIHYGCLRNMGGAHEQAARLRTGGKVDPHQITADILEIPRKAAKEIKLGRAYGLGYKNMAKKLNCTIDEAKAYAKKMDSEFPYAKLLQNEAKAYAEHRGWVKTIGGRKRHFNRWEPVKTQKDWKEGTKYGTAASKEEAQKKWPFRKVQRAFCYRAVNSIIQGSGADMIKLAMVNVYEELGLVPLVQVHDELDYSIPDRETGLRVKEIMEEVLDLHVPILTDYEVGSSWFDLEEVS